MKIQYTPYDEIITINTFEQKDLILHRYGDNFNVTINDVCLIAVPAEFFLEEEGNHTCKELDEYLSTTMCSRSVFLQYNQCGVVGEVIVRIDEWDKLCEYIHKYLTIRQYLNIKKFKEFTIHAVEEQ